MSIEKNDIKNNDKQFDNIKCSLVLRDVYNYLFYTISLFNKYYDESLNDIFYKSYLKHFLNNSINSIQVSSLISEEFNNNLYLFKFLSSCYVLLDILCFSGLKEPIFAWCSISDFIINCCNYLINNDSTSDVNYDNTNKYITNYKEKFLLKLNTF